MLNAHGRARASASFSARLKENAGYRVANSRHDTHSCCRGVDDCLCHRVHRWNRLAVPKTRVSQKRLETKKTCTPASAVEQLIVELCPNDRQRSKARGIKFIPSVC